MKVNNMHRCLLAALITVLFYQCSARKEMQDPKEYMKWMNDPENGLTQTKYANQLMVSVKYLPPEYLAFLECRKDSTGGSRKKDSLIAFYSASKAFLLTIGPDKRKVNGTADVMMVGLEKYEEYKERTMAMNFEMADYVSLATSGGSLHPVLSSMENVYGLSTDRSIYLVFAPDKADKSLKEEPELDFVFNDEIFDTGINHFVFIKKNLDNVPHFIF